MKPGSLITISLPSTIWDVDCYAQQSHAIGTALITDICMVIKESKLEILVLCQNAIVGWIAKLNVAEIH